ncbi:MAG: hypothetical protein IJU54_01900 [Alphaproteobacteria bacterium]|nr:hypothetical protein [Alphaproteobacteria bacterium]
MKTVKLIDIFGNKQSDDNNIANKTDKSNYKNTFPKIDVNTGLNSKQLQSDSLLIHRLLQKKLYNTLDNNIQKFITILTNEMKSKTSNYDISIITRDTLLKYFVK